MHNESPSWLLPATVILAALLVGWAILAASQALARDFNLLVYLSANLIVFMDVFDFVVRLYFRRINAVLTTPGSLSGTSIALDLGEYTAYQKRLHLRPYALMVSVYNAEDCIDSFFEGMEDHRDRLWIIDDGSTDDTCRRIRQAGWRVLESAENRKKPGAIRRLLETLPSEIETVVILDPDTTFRKSSPDELSDLESVIFEFQRSGMAALCPRIAIRQDGFLARLQGFEYCMSFSLGRMSLADNSINSGISIYRRSALAAAFEQHSLSVYAEDLENSTILLGAGERIYYDGRLVAETEGKGTWRSWFSQRVGWAFGLIKVYTEHFSQIRIVARRRLSTAYQFLIYMGGFNLVLQPLKIIAMILLIVSLAKGVDTLFGLRLIPNSGIADPVYFLAAFAKFTLLSLAALLTAVPRRERLFFLPVVPLYFFYSLAQIVPTSVGYANWFSLRLWGRRVWGDHFQDDASLLHQHKQRSFAKATTDSAP